MCRASVRPLLKITITDAKEIRTEILQGFAILRILCRKTHEVTCDIYNTFSPCLPSTPTAYMSSCLCLGCHQGSPKHLPVSGPGLIPTPLLPLSLWVQGLASRYPSGMFHPLLFLPFDVQTGWRWVILVLSGQAQIGKHVPSTALC